MELLASQGKIKVVNTLESRMDLLAGQVSCTTLQNSENILMNLLKDQLGIKLMFYHLTYFSDAS